MTVAISPPQRSGRGPAVDTLATLCNGKYNLKPKWRTRWRGAISTTSSQLCYPTSLYTSYWELVSRNESLCNWLKENNHQDDIYSRIWHDTSGWSDPVFTGFTNCGAVDREREVSGESVHSSAVDREIERVLVGLCTAVQSTERERLVVSLCTAGRVSARSHRPLPAFDLALVLCLGLVRALEWKTPGGGGKVWAG